MNRTITAVAGLEAGHYTDMAHGTGCTVFISRDGAVGGVDVRGGSPGTRETDLLRPMHRVDRVHGVLLSGGSAFGLDAAAGVVNYLAEQGIGFEAGSAVVPIVPAAILFDLNVINPRVRPGPAQGLAACQAASSGPLEEGSVGAGTGATAAKSMGPEAAVKSGFGTACVTLPDGPTVAAAVAVNAYGGVYDHRSGKLIAGPRRQDGTGFDDPVELMLAGGAVHEDQAMTNTTIGVVATDAPLSREEANYLAMASHDGLALTIRPCHTMYDGDTMFSLSTGRFSGQADVSRLGAAAVEVTAQAVLRAVQTPSGLGDYPAISDLSHG